MTKTYEELKSRLASIHDLHMARSILGWDQHTKMPPKGGEVRAEQLGTLDRFSHELFIDDEIGRSSRTCATSRRRPATTRSREA